MKVGMLIVAAICAAIALLGHFAPPAARDARRPVAAAAIADPFADARAYVVASLKDPDSARFGTFARGKGSVICGQVNARNSFGGYSGMSAFVYSPDGPAGDRLYVYDGAANWQEQGIMAEIFDERGCSIGADHRRLLNGRKALREMAEERSSKN